jgi:threonylcarbamoyladenosine tRNA methylthiotransferase MtaB
VLLKVQDGCNSACAFCIVPRLRGSSRSLAFETACAQLETLVAAGAPEVVLTGIHLGAYGRDLRPRRSLAELVASMVPRLGGARLRLSSIDPHEVTDDVVELMREHPRRICRHVHLPVQSGDPDVLRRMRRSHHVEDFFALAERLVTAIPGIAIGTDILVGFPGESRAAFERSIDLVEHVPLAYAHVFPFSPRPGTPAAEMSDQVPRAEAVSRGRELREIVADRRRAFLRGFVGRCLSAVVLGPARAPELLALTDNYIELRFTGDPGLGGRWVELEVRSPEGAAALVP